MRKLTMACFMVLMCGGLVLTWGQATYSRGKGKASSMAQGHEAQPGKNKAVAQQVFEDLFTKGREDLVDQIYARDCVFHTNNKDSRLQEAVEEGKGFRSAAPDLVMTVDQAVEHGDRVDIRWTARGTNTGKGNGIPASGKKFQVHGTSRFRFADGKIAEQWTTYDHRGMLRQLGVSQ